MTGRSGRRTRSWIPGIARCERPRKTDEAGHLIAARKRSHTCRIAGVRSAEQSAVYTFCNIKYRMRADYITERKEQKRNGYESDDAYEA